MNAEGILAIEGKPGLARPFRGRNVLMLALARSWKVGVLTCALIFSSVIMGSTYGQGQAIIASLNGTVSDPSRQASGGASSELAERHRSGGAELFGKQRGGTTDCRRTRHFGQRRPGCVVPQLRRHVLQHRIVFAGWDLGHAARLGRRNLRPCSG